MKDEASMIVLRSHLTGELINSNKHPDVSFFFGEKQDFLYYRRQGDNSEVGGKIYCVYEKLLRFGVKFFLSSPTPLKSEKLADDFVILNNLEFKDLRMADELGCKRAMVWNYLVEDYMDYNLEEYEKQKVKLALIDLIKDNTSIERHVNQLTASTSNTN